MPGIAAGCLLTFILCLGYYITPALVGGPTDQMVSYFVALYTNRELNWGMASALGAILLAATLILYYVYNKIIGVVKDFHFKSLHDPIEPLLINLEEHNGRGFILVKALPGQTREAIASIGTPTSAQAALGTTPSIASPTNARTSNRRRAGMALTQLRV